MSAISTDSQSIAALLRPTPQLAGSIGAQRPQGVPGLGGKLQSFAEQAGYDPSAIASVQEDLRTALEEVKAGGVEEPKAFIESALRDSLEANGIDPEKFKSDIQAQVQSQIEARLQSLGGDYGLQSGADRQTDLLQELFGDSDESQSLGELAKQLSSQLPAGSLVNRFA